MSAFVTPCPRLLFGCSVSFLFFGCVGGFRFFLFCSLFVFGLCVLSVLFSEVVSFCSVPLACEMCAFDIQIIDFFLLIYFCFCLVLSGIVLLFVFICISLAIFSRVCGCTGLWSLFFAASFGLFPCGDCRSHLLFPVWGRRRFFPLYGVVGWGVFVFPWSFVVCSCS